VIMVSHDRYLIEACADQLWVVANKTVTNFDGDLEDYRKLVMQIRAPRTPARERAASDEKPVRTKEKRVSPKQQVAEAESEMERITGIIEKIDTALALPDIFTKDPKQAAQLTKARAAAADALARAEEQWLSASALLEDANSV
jgi:ATP-binding cassette, subfamily F, member 3